MNRREKEPTGRRVEEGLKNLHRMLDVKNKIKKGIKMKNNKATTKSRNLLICFISIVIGLAASIFCISRFCNNESTNAVIAIVGIVLAFIGIFLSYKGLMVTNEVKEDIALQQFKIKQQEVVDKLVYLLNARMYDILLKVNNNGVNTNAYIKANLYGIVGLYNSTEYDFKIFNKCQVLDEEVGVIKFANDYVANPYLPISISSSLARLLQNDKQINKTNNPNDRVVFSEITETQNTVSVTNSNNQDQEQINTSKIYSDWGTWVEDVDSLFANIRECYNKEHHNIEPNLLMLKKVVSYYPPKK